MMTTSTVTTSPQPTHQTQMALAFGEYLKEAEALAWDEAKQWVRENWDEEQDAYEERKANLVLSYGYQHNRGLWHRDANKMLVWGPDPSRAEVEKPPRESLTASAKALPALGRGRGDNVRSEGMTSPEQQFFELGVDIGIPERPARAASNFIAKAWDLYNPQDVYRGLTLCPEINHGQRYRWWYAWTAQTGPHGEMPPGFAEKVAHDFGGPRVQDGSAGSEGQRQDRRPVRLYIVLPSGEITRTVDDDPEGMSLTEARILAEHQAMRAAQAAAQNQGKSGESALATYLAQKEETDRERMRVEAEERRQEEDRRSSSTEWLRLMMDQQSKAEEARQAQQMEIFKLMQDNQQARLDMISRERERDMDILGKSLGQLAEAVSSTNQQDPWAPLERLMPGIAKDILDQYRHPRTMTPEGPMTAEERIRYEDTQTKRMGIRVLADNAPRFVEGLIDLAAATREIADERGHTIESEQAEQSAAPMALQALNCGHCDGMVSVPYGTARFDCPYCGARQTPEGEMLALPQGEEERQQSPMAETVPPPGNIAPPTEAAGTPPIAAPDTGEALRTAQHPGIRVIQVPDATVETGPESTPPDALAAEGDGEDQLVEATTAPQPGAGRRPASRRRR